MKREEYISDEMVVKRINVAVRKKKGNGCSNNIHDRETQIIYQENGDGS